MLFSLSRATFLFENRLGVRSLCLGAGIGIVAQEDEAPTVGEFRTSRGWQSCETRFAQHLYQPWSEREQPERTFDTSRLDPLPVEG